MANCTNNNMYIFLGLLLLCLVIMVLNFYGYNDEIDSDKNIDVIKYTTK